MPLQTDVELDEYIGFIVEGFFLAKAMHDASPCTDGKCDYESYRGRLRGRFPIIEALT